MKREFTIGVAWTAAASWLEQGVGGLVFMVIARLVGVEGFGVASMTFAFLFLGEFLVRDTVTEAIVERKELEDGRLEATFVALTAFSAAIVALLMLASPLVAKMYGEPQVAPLLIAASPTVLMIGVAGVSTALLRRRLEYRTLATRSVLGVVLSGVVGVAMAAKGFGPWSLIGQRVTEIGINSVFAFRAAGWWPQRWPTRSDFALLHGLGPRVVLLRSVALVVTQTPVLALGIFANPHAVGLFAFAWRLVEITASLIVKPIQGVAQSAIAAMRRQHGSTEHFFLDLTELAAFGSFTAFAGIVLVAEPLVTAFLGAGWRGAGAPLQALCAAGAVAALAAIQEAYLLAIDRLQAFVRMMIVEAVLGALIIFAASPYGPTAVGLAVALRALLVFPLRARVALAPEAITPMHYALALRSPALLTAGMFMAVGIWRFVAQDRMADWMFVATAITIGVVVAGGLLFGLMPNTVSRLRSFIHPAT